MTKSRINKNEDPQWRIVYSDSTNTVYEYPKAFRPAFRSGKQFVPVPDKELIELPYGSLLFNLPQRHPVYYDPTTGEFPVIRSLAKSSQIWALSAFLCSGYLWTYLPAFVREKDAPPLSLWAYAGVVIKKGKFFVPGLRVDPDPRSDPKLHEDEKALDKMAGKLELKYPENRLVKQLSLCAREYRCLCARNFFLGRFEAPLPSSPSCNARCLGCLSLQKDSGFSESQFRLNFLPSAAEMAEVMLHHITMVEQAVVSFGQGCEGEPLLRAEELAKAVGLVRDKTSRGTIHLNTNGSLPEKLRTLLTAGLDSVRVSLNSPTEKYYNAYFRMSGFNFQDIQRSISLALDAGIFVSLNLFFMPGFTDMEKEVEALLVFLKKFPVHMIQTRNLNMDPDYYLDTIGFEESKPLGIRNLLVILKNEFPDLKIGYYNPPKERF